MLSLDGCFYAHMETIGTIECFSRWMVAWVDPEISRYYRALLPKAWYVNPPQFNSHISIVRDFEEADRNLWNKYQGYKVSIEYDLPVYFDGPYYWLDAFCPKIEHIRMELGLSPFLGDFNCQHITVGNTK